MERFEQLMLMAQKSGTAEEWRGAIINVADTAYICRAWLEDNAPGFTPADLLTMTKMVMDQEAIAYARRTFSAEE